MSVRASRFIAFIVAIVCVVSLDTASVSTTAAATPLSISKVVVGENGRPYLQVDGQPYLYLGAENWGKQQTLGGCDQCSNWRYSLPQFSTPLPTSWLENVFEKTKAAGYNTISMILDWNQIEPTTQGSFDWSLVDQYITWANKYDLRIDWVWFGTLNECGARLPGNTNGWMTWVPSYVQDKSKYFGRGIVDQDVYCAWLPDGGTHNADASYLFSSERNAVANLFAHLATVDTTHRAILFQDENEPNFHPDWNNAAGKTLIRSLLSSMAQVVKQSNYPVAVRINAWGYANSDFNNIPYVDFQGTDLYSTDPTALKTSTFNTSSAGPLPGIAENDGSYGNVSSLATTAIAGGAYYDSFQLNDHFPPQGLYDPSSYYKDWVVGTIPPLRPGAARMQRELTAINKVRTIVASASPSQMAGFNSDAAIPSTSYNGTKNAGPYPVSFSTADAAVAIAFNQGNSVYLASDTATTETFTFGSQPQSVSVGHQDNSTTWVQDSSRSYTNNGNGSYSISYNQGEMIRVTLSVPPVASKAASWLFNDGSGSIAADSSGNGRTGTLNGGISWSAGQSGSALQFDGSSGYVSASWGLITGNAPRTISTWFKTTSAADANWVSWGTNSPNGLSQLGIYGGNMGYLGYGNDLTVSAAPYIDGNWHQLVASFNGGGMTLYVDAKPLASQPMALNTGSSSTINIGRSITGSGYFAGTLDEVSVSTQALDGDQVKAAAVSSAAYWGLGEGSGLTAADSTGNNRTASLNGAIAWSRGSTGNALQFDGSSGYLSAPWNQLSGNSSRTLSTWFETTSSANSNWLSWGTNSPNGLSQLGVFGGNLGYLGYANDLTVPVSSYTDGAWHQLVATFNGSSLALYVDGAQVATKTTTLATGASSTINIGRSISGDSGTYFSGALDELAVYPKALSSAEVTTLFAAK